jgi:hypothetical protein
MRKILLFLLLFVGFSAHGQFVVSTVPPLTGGTSTTGGITFALRSSVSVFLDTVYCRFTTAVGTTTDFRLWYTATDTVGSVNVAAPNWTMLQDPVTVTVGTPNQLNVPQIVAIPIPGGLLMNAGETFRFYVGVLSGSVSYNSMTSGTVDYYGDGNLTIVVGTNYSYAGGFPSPTLTPRALNGGVAYRFATGLDARPSAILSPQTLSIGPNLVSVRVQNAAADPIASATIGYQVNNDPPVVTSGHTFSSPIAPGQTEDYTFPTPINVAASTTMQLKVWTTNANGLGPDVNTSNDTLLRTVCTGISGVFSVGGAGADYNDLTEVVNTLNLCGVTGPVVFNINPGTYYGTYVLGNVPGASSVNSITFAAATGVASSVVLIHDTAASANNRAHFIVGGNSKVAFQNLTFIRTINPPAAGQAMVAFGSGADEGSVVNCVFDDQARLSSTFNVGLLSEASFGTFVNNMFMGFYYPIQLNGVASAPWKSFNTVQSNIIEQYIYRAIYGLNQDILTIDGNIIRDFSGTSTAGAGIWTSNTNAMNISANQIVGGMSGYGILIANANGDSLDPTQNTNKIYNNVVSGTQATSLTSTTLIIYPLYVSGSYSATAIPANPRDAMEIVNNTFLYSVNTTSTSTGQAGAYFLGGTTAAPAFSLLRFQNNHLEVNPVSGDLPPAFRLVRFANAAIIDSLVSSNNNYLMSGATVVPPYFRENGGAMDYTTLTDWRTATGKDTLSLNLNPGFISAALPIPTSIALDNQGVPLSFVSTDIQGFSRSTTTPDIGAYEFEGAVYSQISFVPLTDTLINTSRLLTATITDSLSTITAGTARLFYKKSNQTTWQLDTLPSVNGNDYTFLINYSALGGVVAMDTIQYYIAVRNATNTVTTEPLGGSGLYLSTQQLPPTVHAYLIRPVISGNYNVGVSGPADFPTLTAAANFINNGFMGGAATFTLIDSAYDSNETFPILLSGRPGASATNTLTLKPATNRSQVVVSGSVAGTSGLFIIQNGKYLTIDGSNNGSNSRNLHLVNNSVSTTNATIHAFNEVGESGTAITLKNLIISGSQNNALGAMGIHLGNATITTAGLGEGFSDVLIENNAVNRAGIGIYARGTVAGPIMGIAIRNNIIGATDTASFIGNKGIDLQNAVMGRIEGNEVFNLLTSNSTTLVGIEIGGTGSDSVRVTRNHIHDLTTQYFTLPAVWGINIASGNNFTIDNNVISGLQGGNYSNTSNFYNPSGIRIASGTGHRIYYNSINLYHTHTNTASTNASAPSAFTVTSTAVSGLDIKNNVFSNSMRSTGTAQSFFVAMWFPTSFSFAGTEMNNNAYQVDTTANHYVGRVGTATTSPLYSNVVAWQGASAATMPGNDLLSVPPFTNAAAPFISNSDLRIQAGATTGIESGAVVIPVLGTPNTDFTGVARPAGSGIAPDMGAYEFTGVALPDIFPPIIDSVLLSPDFDQCVPTARTITVYARDNNGGSGIDSVMVNYTIDSVAQTPIRLSLNSGTVMNGSWTGTIPPAAGANQRVDVTVSVRDSLANFAVNVNLLPYRDDYLTLNISNDTTIVQGDSATLRAGAGFAGGRNLEATRTGGNGQSGVTFNITAIQSILLDSINVPLYGTIGSPATVEIWYSTTAINGAPSITSPGWTQIQPGYATTIGNSGTAANGVLSQILIPGGLLIPAGSTYGIYIGGASLAYTSHVAGNISNFTDGLVTIENGPNVGYGGAAPSPTFHPRQFNGSVSYRSAANVDWTILGGGTAGQGDTIRVSPLTTTTYIATISDANCSKSDTVTVTVNPLQLNPDVGVSSFVTPVSGATVNGTSPIPVTVIIKNYGPVPATGFDVEYRVNGGNSIVTNSITQTIAPGDSLQHTFSVAWTPTTGGQMILSANTTGVQNELNRANDTAFVTVNSTVSVEQLALNSRLIGKVYPNPAVDQVNFEFNELQGEALLEIRDQLGRVVFSNNVNRENGQLYSLSTTDWSAGIYSYSLRTLDQLQVGQLVIKR